MSTPRDSQDQYDVIQAQDEWDSKTAVAEPDADLSTVNTERSDLSKHIADLFHDKYAVNPLQPAGQLVKTWMMLHDEIQNIVESLEVEISRLTRAVQTEKISESEETHYTS